MPKFNTEFHGFFTKLNRHTEYMQRALHISVKYRQMVSPNPFVGCVIVKNGAIIGEGYHQYFGGPHAEVLAVRDASEPVQGSSVYVTLEPCSHFGKTPPCTRLLINSGVGRVYIGIRDPNPVMRSDSINILTSAGIEVHTGLLEKDISQVNKGFLKWIRTGMPWVVLKIARSANNLISVDRQTRTVITGHEVRKEVHRLRAETDAVLIGSGTALCDDPQLTVRDCTGTNPVRYITDTDGTLPKTLKIFRDNKAETRVFVSSDMFESHDTSFARIIAVRPTARGLDPLAMLKAMGRDGISSVMIEGGELLGRSFLEDNLVDEVIVYTAPELILQGEIKNPFVFKKNWQKIEKRSVGCDIFERYQKIESLCSQES